MNFVFHPVIFLLIYTTIRIEISAYENQALQTFLWKILICLNKP